MHHLAVEQWSRGQSPLHALDARVKLAGLLGFLVALALTPRISPPLAAGFLGLVVCGLAVGGLPAGGVLLRAAVVLPFSATFAAVTALAGDPARAASLVIRSYCSAAAVLVLIGTTPLPKLLRGLESLGAPAFLVLVVQFVYRYLFVLSEQAQHMRLAAACRGSFSFRAAAGAIAVLFVRSHARAEAIHSAMLARGAFHRRDAEYPQRRRREDEKAFLCENSAPSLRLCGESLIEVHRLRYRYGDGTQALDGVDFSMAPGETVALLGPNGSGKTTFVHHLNGLLSGEGSVTVGGLPVERKNLAAIRRKVGLVFQDSDEQLFMPTVLEDVAFGPLNRGLDPAAAQAAARRALEQVGMAAALGKAPYHLSAGEKKRVALAGVLAMEAEILVLDEPTTFLDPPGRRGLIELLERLPQAKILVTHDVRFAAALARRAVFFQQGRIVADGPLEEIVGRFSWTAGT